MLGAVLRSNKLLHVGRGFFFGTLAAFCVLALVCGCRDNGGFTSEVEFRFCPVEPRHVHAPH